MKDYLKKYLKNPNLYYIAAPAAAALWVLLAGLVFYPRSVNRWEDTVKPEYEKTQEWIEKLVALEPQRLQYKTQDGQSAKFDFGETIDTLTQLFGIPSSKFTLNVRPEVPKGDKRARTATMNIKEIDIEKMTRFLSSMLSGWPDLSCETLSLEKTKAGKNTWAVDLTLTYYY